LTEGQATARPAKLSTRLPLFPAFGPKLGLPLVSNELSRARYWLAGSNRYHPYV